MSESTKKKKSKWYYIGQSLLGLLGVGVAFSGQILDAFPDHTLVSQWSIPIAGGIKVLWDIWMYQKDALPETMTRFYDKLPDPVTGKKGGKGIKNLSKQIRNAISNKK